MTGQRIVPFSYLDRQFADVEPYLQDLRQLVRSGDFTLGQALSEFETTFCTVSRMPYAVGVASGTDALEISLRVLKIGPGDEVITAVNTFIATVDAIVMTGARPVLVDNEDGFTIDPEKIEEAITPKTRAIIPVHLTGNMADMPAIMRIARARGIHVVEDACQAIEAELDGQSPGHWGETAAYSLHPLKNLNLWGEAGVVVTRTAALSDEIRTFRNYGLINRNEAHIFGKNSRFDTLQAVVGNRIIKDISWITRRRIEIARRYDEAFSDLGDDVSVPCRRAGVKHVFHLYMLRVKRRDELLDYLQRQGIEAKVHYPMPLHLQVGAASLGYDRGDFPVAERDASQIITLPAHQHLTESEIEYTIECVSRFVNG